MTRRARPAPSTDLGAFELAKQLGIDLPTGAHASPVEKAKRKRLLAELEADLAAPLVERKP